MRKLTHFILSALFLAAPLALQAMPQQPLPTPSNGGRPPAPVPTQPTPGKVDDRVKDALKDKEADKSRTRRIEAHCRGITYKKDGKEVNRYFQFHKLPDGTFKISEMSKLGGEEIKSPPEALSWVLECIGLKESTDHDGNALRVAGPNGKTYKVNEAWHSSTEGDSHGNLSKGPHGEKLVDTDDYVKTASGWKKEGHGKPGVAASDQTRKIEKTDLKKDTRSLEKEKADKPQGKSR